MKSLAEGINLEFQDNFPNCFWLCFKSTKKAVGIYDTKVTYKLVIFYACTHTHAHTDTHTISKYHHLGISKNVENGKLLDVVFLESREDSWKNKGLWYWNPKFQAHFPHLRGTWLLVTLIFLTFRFIFYKIKIIRLHYKVVIRIEWDNMKTLNEKLGVWNVRTFLNNRHM